MGLFILNILVYKVIFLWVLNERSKYDRKWSDINSIHIDVVSFTCLIRDDAIIPVYTPSSNHTSTIFSSLFRVLVEGKKLFFCLSQFLNNFLELNCDFSNFKN